MTNLIFKGFTEIDQPAQFITVVKKHGFEMVTGHYIAAKGLNVDSLIIGQSYEGIVTGKEVTL